ncbi:MAG: hypothetical protein KBH07_06935 [Flavobacteriales bacterium]|nr:hypothetical protein [Flavobacteriales bacterium]MBP9079732.1 hypothetical protein [Flavobacteriales bacterium]
MKKYVVWGVVAIVACAHLNVVGPDWNSAGIFGLPANSFLGTTDGVPINFRANNTLGMRLLESLTGQTIGSCTNENLCGNVRDRRAAERFVLECSEAARCGTASLIP